MELIEILLFFCTGTIFINIILMGLIWLSDKKDLYLYGVGLWVAALFNYGLQGIFESQPILSILSFATYYVCSLILVRVFQLTTNIDVPYLFYHVVMGLGVGLMLVLAWVGSSFTLMSIPVAVGVALPVLHISIRYLTGSNTESMSNVYAIILILNGLHLLDYPFLRPVPEFAIYGFAIAFIFLLFLSIYFPIYTTRSIGQRYSQMLEMEIKKHLKIEQQLQAEVLAEKSAARAKSEFLANMNHELRTPLNGIMGMNNMMLHSDFDEEEIRESAVIIGQSSDALLSLVDSLSEVNRLESGRLELDESPFSPKDCVNGVLARYEDKASNKGLSMTSAFGDDMPELIVGDKDRLAQVLDGLVDNAIKFTPSGGVNVSAFLIDRHHSPSEIVFEVLDTGIGLSQEEQKRIFGIFDEADASLARSGGAGVGLYVGKRLVSLMGGELSCRSEKGKGAVFKFNFPLDAGARSSCD